MKKLLIIPFLLITSLAIAASTTANYGLYKPAVGDTNWGELMNASTDAIDTQMKANADAVGDADSDSTWTLHNSYPSACSAGDYVSAIGDTLTCSTPTDNNTTYTAGGTLLDLTGTTFSINEGTLTDTKYCIYTAGTGIVCDTTPAGTGDLLADGTVPLTADWDAGDSTYDITAVEFKGALVGNASTATALASNPTDCGANQFANTIAANGNLSCSAIADADVPDDITVDLAATATALASNPTDCGAGEYATTIAANGNLTCSALTTESTTAGRSLTLSTYSVEADAELYTDTKCAYIEDPTAETLSSLWTAPTAVTITGINCESDDTVTLDLSNAGSAVNDSNISCTSTWAEDTSLAGDATVAANAQIDVVIASGGSATWVSVCWEFTKDD